MTNTIAAPSSEDPALADAARFDAALSRLELALAASVQKIAEMARATGFEDGLAQANAQSNETPTIGTDLSPILREELEAARVREANLQAAVTAARDALDDAMDDIRAAIGPL
jgi:hypothetical protein